MEKDLQKKSRLSGQADSQHVDHPEYLAQKDIKTVDEQTIEIMNPLTRNKATITINREGTTEQRLAAILLHPDATVDEKDLFLSNYLLEKGLDSASFLAELYRSKGAFTKESRLFKTQMRFDYESFVNMFTIFLDTTADSIIKNLTLVEPADLYEKVVSLISNKKCDSIREAIIVFLKQKDIQSPNIALLEMAVRYRDQAETLRSTTRKITEERAREKGYGIYIGTNGKIYSIFDKDIEEQMLKDKDVLRKVEETKQ